MENTTQLPNPVALLEVLLDYSDEIERVQRMDSEVPWYPRDRRAVAYSVARTHLGDEAPDEEVAALRAFLEAKIDVANERRAERS